LSKIEGPVILIAGGRDKGLDYSKIRPYLKRVKQILLIGEAADKIRRGIGDFTDIAKVSSLEKAVKEAYSRGVCGDTVLLSPMCASFDMFKNYEHRGEMFKKAVYKLH